MTSCFTMSSHTSWPPHALRFLSGREQSQTHTHHLDGGDSQSRMLVMCVCVCVWATVSFCYPVHETWFKSSLRRTVRIVLWHKNQCWLLRRRRWRRLSLLCNCCQMLFVIVLGWLFRVSHNTKHHIMKNKQIIPSSSSSYSQNFYCSMAPPVELTWQIRLCSIPTMLCNTTLMWLVEKLKNYIWKGFNCLK